MLFNSPEFLFLFLPLTIIVFFQISGRGYQKIAIVWLVAASFFFYGWWQASYVFLLTSSILFNYFLGFALSRISKTAINQRKLLFGLGILCNLILLFYFKYTNFIVNTVNQVIGTQFHIQTIILPLAISFFTFNQVAYLFDAYRGEAEEDDFWKYCLFVSFFPHLIAGPIVHHKEMMPQINNNFITKFNQQDFAVGLTIFCIGLFKKVVFADSVSNYANPVFESILNGKSIGFFEAWFGILGYSYQLYFDFSGYSDMAIGSARIFGIKFPMNFHSPYKSVSIGDFWRRWHITLSNFLRDYIYIPLGGNRQGELRRYINLVTTMLLGGLWHGAGWNFVIWGGLHGIYLVIHRIWQLFSKKIQGHDLNQRPWWSKNLAQLLTFISVMVAWVFFRTHNLAEAFMMLKAMLGANGFDFVYLVNKLLPIATLCLLSFVVFLTPNTQEWMAKYEPTLDFNQAKFPQDISRFWQKLQWQPSLFHSVCVGFIAFISILKLFSISRSEFLYFNF